MSAGLRRWSRRRNALAGDQEVIGALIAVLEGLVADDLHRIGMHAVPGCKMAPRDLRRIEADDGRGAFFCTDHGIYLLSIVSPPSIGRFLKRVFAILDTPNSEHALARR